MINIAAKGSIYAIYPVTDPVNRQQELKYPERDQWQDAIKIELEYPVENQTREVVTRPPDVKEVSSNYVFKVKRKHTGAI